MKAKELIEKQAQEVFIKALKEKSRQLSKLLFLEWPLLEGKILTCGTFKKQLKKQKINY